MRAEGVGFYRLDEERRGVTVSIMEVALWAAKGQGEEGVLLLASWRASWASWHRKRRSGEVAVMLVSGGAWQMSASSTTGTVLGRGNGGVWELPGVEVIVREEVEVRARSTSTGTDE